MQFLLRQAILKRLAALSIAAAAGLTNPSAALLRFPSEILTQVVEDAADLEWMGEDRRRLLDLLACDQRVSVRRRVAEVTGSLAAGHSDGMLEILKRLARDESVRVRAAAGQGLAAVLANVAPVERVQIVCEWALSGEAFERAAVARALSDRTPVLVTDMVIGQLAADPHPEVRLHALKAATVHFDEDPEGYACVARACLSDPDRATRRTARRLVSRTA